MEALDEDKLPESEVLGQVKSYLSLKVPSGNKNLISY